jgi:hypothetical protein
MKASERRLVSKGNPRHVWLNVTPDPAWCSPALELFTREAPGPRGMVIESWTVSASIERPSGALKVRQGWAMAEHLKPGGPPPPPRAPRHVEVRLGKGSLDTRPGLLLFWWGIPAIGGQEWLAWVAWAEGGGFHQVVLQKEWLRADQLRPAACI